MRLAFAAPIVAFPMMSTQGLEKPVWQEAEEHAEFVSGLERGMVELPFASGGKATPGALYRQTTDHTRYILDLPQNYADARIVVRYARLHWKEGMQPARLLCEAINEGESRQAVLTLGDTGGWGRRSASDWRFAEADLGALKAGRLEIVLRPAEEACDANIDGFYILPGTIGIEDEETRELNRVSFASDHFVGMNLHDAPILQDEFPGFDLVGKGLGRERVKYSVLIKDQDEKSVVSLTADSTLELDDSRLTRAAVAPGPVRDLPDGSYTVEAIFEDGRRLSMPFITVGNLIKQVNAKLGDYRQAIEKLEAAARTDSLLADLHNAVDYIENTLILLEARRKGSSADAGTYRAALAYFENSRQRSTEDFAADLRKIMAQTDQTLALLEQGQSPYEGRTGDMRRAFVSEATGVLEPYRIFVPKAYERLESIPLLLLLHGGGGDENYFPDLDGGAILEVLEERPYLMLSPRSTSWYEGDGLKDLEQLIELIRTLYPKVDPSRIYCSGVSRGGFGSYTLATHRPGLLKAIACVSGTSRDNAAIEKLADTPVLIIHGGVDPVVLPSVAEETARRLKELDYEHRLEIFPQHGHEFHGKLYLNLALDYFEQLDSKD